MKMITRDTGMVGSLTSGTYFEIPFINTLISYLYNLIDFDMLTGAC